MKRRPKARIYEYRLSKKQEQARLSEELKLSSAEGYQSRLKKYLVDYDSLVNDYEHWSPIQCLIQGSYRECTVVRPTKIFESDLILASGNYKGELEFKCNPSDYLRPSNLYSLVEVFRSVKRQRLQTRIELVLTEIKEIEQYDRSSLDQAIIAKHRKLLQELHSLFSQIVSKRQQIYRIMYGDAPSCQKLDNRARIRRLSAFLFKWLPDFSGCEEESGLTEFSVNPIHSHLNNRKKCFIIKLLYYPRLIPLSNLRMTG